MKRVHKLYCRDNRNCPAGFSCLGGECKEDPVPDPPLVGDSETEDHPPVEDEN